MKNAGLTLWFGANKTFWRMMRAGVFILLTFVVLKQIANIPWYLWDSGPRERGQVVGSVLLVIWLVTAFFMWRKYRGKMTRRFVKFVALSIVVSLLSAAIIPSPTYSWDRVHSNDKFLSVEFPRQTTGKKNVETSHVFSKPRSTVEYKLFGERVRLSMDCVEIPEGQKSITVDERNEGLRLASEQHGFIIKSFVREDLNGFHEDGFFAFRAVVENPSENTRTIIRMIYTPSMVYFVKATSSAGLHDNVVVSRFINSLQINPDWESERFLNGTFEME